MTRAGIGKARRFQTPPPPPLSKPFPSIVQFLQPIPMAGERERERDEVNFSIACAIRLCLLLSVRYDRPGRPDNPFVTGKLQFFFGPRLTHPTRAR